MTRAEAIKEMQSYADNSWGGLSEAFELAITALREQEQREQGLLESYLKVLESLEQREQGCLYCDGTEGDLYFREGACPQMNDVVYISGNQIHCDFGCKAWGAFGIKFCPMCGRRLED